jgi:hypothetical protein
MSAPETSDELRALVKELRYEAADQACFLRHARLHNQAANAIEALLARLTAAEADADRLAAAVGWPPVGGVVEVLRLHGEAVALRERPHD